MRTHTRISSHPPFPPCLGLVLHVSDMGSLMIADQQRKTKYSPITPDVRGPASTCIHLMAHEQEMRQMTLHTGAHSYVSLCATDRTDYLAVHESSLNGLLIAALQHGNRKSAT